MSPRSPLKNAKVQPARYPWGWSGPSPILYLYVYVGLDAVGLDALRVLSQSCQIHVKSYIFKAKVSDPAGSDAVVSDAARSDAVASDAPADSCVDAVGSDSQGVWILRAIAWPLPCSSRPTSIPSRAIGCSSLDVLRTRALFLLPPAAQ